MSAGTILRQTPVPRRADTLAHAFDLPGGPDAVLLLHGLSGSPFEVRSLAERLHLQSMRCLGPLLPGHGGEPQALARVSRSDWLAGARQGLQRLAGARRTFVVGCSMGALLALALAAEAPGRVDALVLLAPALRLAPGPALAGWLARHTPLGRLLPPLPKGTSDVRDAEMRALNPALRAVPIAAVGELQRLAREVDDRLPSIAAPALVIAGGRDHTVRLSGARRVAERIGSGPARLLLLPQSFHLVGIDVERDLVAEETAAFLHQIPARGRRE
jgi:carboxylesterase